MTPESTAAVANDGGDLEFPDPLAFDNRREDSLAGLLARLQFDF